MATASENFGRAQDIDAILDMRRIAIVGLSSDPARESYGVARYLLRQGYEVIPVNPNKTEVLGLRAYPSLQSLPEPPEVVDVFRRSEYVAQVVEEAIEVGAKAVWLQLGVIDYEAAHRAREAGLLVVMDHCIRIAHANR